MKFIEHILLNTGDSRPTYRSEVADEVVAFLGPLVRKAETGSRVAFDRRGYTIRRIAPAKSVRGCVVWAINEPHDGPPVGTVALALKEKTSASLWRSLHTLFNQDPNLPRLATWANDPPPAPWLGAIFHPPQAKYRHARDNPADWLADAERCIAWAWIEHVYRHAN